MRILRIVHNTQGSPSGADASSARDPQVALLRRKRRPGQRGGSGVEFALSTIFWVPLLVGTFNIGFKLVSANKAQQVCRDVGHMYAYGVDFSQSANQAVAINLAQGLGMSTTAGPGVIILSVMKMIGSSDCTASGYVPNGTTPNTTNCPNLNQVIISQRLYIGNTTLRNSNFGTPASGLLDSSGNITPTQQVSNTALRAPSFSNLLTLASSQVGFLTESYFVSPDLNGSTTNGIYSRVIF
jgi:hypothetical protein